MKINNHWKKSGTKPAASMVVLALTGLLTVNLALAGGDGTRGGADGVSCNGGIFELFLGHGNTAVADSYPSWNGNRLPLGLLDFADPDTILDSIISYVQAVQPDEAASIRKSLSELTFEEVKKIPKIDTGFKLGLFDKFFGCSRKQLAVQNLETGYVSLSQEEYGKKLTHLSKALVKLHEAYIHKNLLSDPSASLETLETRARGDVWAIYDTKGFNNFVVKDLVARAGWPASDVSKVLRPWVRTIFWDFSDARYDVNDLNQVLDAGFDPNYELPNEMPILLYSLVRSGALDARDFVYSDALISHGARVDSTDIYGYTVLFLAMSKDLQYRMYNGHTYPMLAFFLSKNADINAPICERTNKPVVEGSPAQSILDVAISWKEKDVQKFLMSHGAKTGQELGLVCKAAPAMTQEEVDTQNKAFKDTKFMFPEMW